MAKKVIGFSNESDFDRMGKAVKKVESMPMVGQRQRAKYPIGGGPVVKRGVISELGDYGVHRVTLLSGSYTEDLTTDGLTHTRTDVEAYVAEEFDYHFNIGDIVILAKIGGQYWIIEPKPDCEGYCIHEDFAGDGYIYGWSFRAPNLPCCPEAGGVHILTTSDSGTTYETAAFQCNSDGTDRKWVYNTTKKSLRISPMLEQGNIEYRTDSTPAACTVQLQRYEQQLFPGREDCGKIPKSVCLNPLCGVGTCSGCTGLSPMAWQVTFGGGTPNPEHVTPATYCNDIEGTYIFQRIIDKDNGTDQCAWEVVRLSNATYNGPTGITYSSGSSAWNIVFNNNSLIYTASGSLDCTNEIELTASYVEDPDCVGYPETVKMIPYGGDFLEDNCYPKSVGYMLWDFEDIYCGLVPFYLELELTGITDGTCDQCSVLNDLHRMSLYNKVIARWDGPDITGNCLSAYDANPGFELTVDPSSDVTYLKFGSQRGSPSVIYTGPAPADWNCLGPNAFTYSSDNGECDNWPATITVYPLVDE